MRKILFAANLDSFFTKFLIPQIKYFKEKGYEVHIAAKSENIEIPYCDKKYNVPFARGFSLKDNKNSYVLMKQIIKQENYDVIFCHTPFGGAITRLVAKKVKSKAKIIYMAHGFHCYKGASPVHWLLYYNVEKYLSKYTDLIITINQEDYNIANNKFKCKIDYVEGIGLIREKFDNVNMDKNDIIEYRKKLGIKPNDFVIIYTAEITKRKRQKWLIETLSDFLKTHDDVHLLLPGKDSLNEKCQQFTKKLKLENKVHFLGFRKDIPNLLKISNLAVSASMQEGLPVNIMEAMYMKLPIIVSDCRGNSDLVENDINGYVIKKNDREDFSNKVCDIYDGKVNIKKFSSNSGKIIEKYLLENVMNEYIKIYENLGL